MAQRLLNTAIPVGLDQVLEIPAVGRSGVRNVCLTLLDFANDATGAKGERTVVGEPSLKLSFVPLVVDCDDVSSQTFFFLQLHREITSLPALLHQFEAPTASVVASKHTRPVAKLNFMVVVFLFCVGEEPQ